MWFKMFFLAFSLVLLSVKGLGQFPCVDAYIAAINAQLSKRNYEEAKSKLLDMKDNCPSELQKIDKERKSLLASLISRINPKNPQNQLKRNTASQLFVTWNETAQKYGYVNRYGKKITDFIYDEAQEIEDGYAFVRKGDNEGLIDAFGREVRPLEYFDIKYNDDDGDDILDKDENSVLPLGLKGKKVEVERVEPIGRVLIFMNKVILTVDGKMGLFDCATRKFTIPLSEHGIGGLGLSELIPKISTSFPQSRSFPLPSFTGDYLVLITRKITEDLLSYSLVNFDNKVIVPFGKYVKINEWGPFDGFIEVRKESGVGLIDCKGNEKIKPVYADMQTPWNGLIAVQNKASDLWGLIDYEGNKVIDFRFKNIKKEQGYFSNNLCAVQGTNGLWGFIDIKGNFVIACRYKDVIPFLGRYALADLGGLRWIVIDNKGNKLDTKYADYASGELKTGFVDKRGKIIIIKHSSDESSILEIINEKGEIEEISMSFLPYYINFEGYKESDYLELLTFDLKIQNMVRLLIGANGNMEYRAVPKKESK